MYFYLWEHHLVLLHGMVAEYIGRAVKAGMPDGGNVFEKQLVRPTGCDVVMGLSRCATIERRVDLSSAPCALRYNII